jgi:hypothetical protein
MGQLVCRYAAVPLWLGKLAAAQGWWYYRYQVLKQPYSKVRLYKWCIQFLTGQLVCRLECTREYIRVPALSRAASSNEFQAFAFSNSTCTALHHGGPDDADGEDAAAAGRG